MNTGKLLFAGALLAALGGIMTYWLTSKTSEDQGALIPLGFCNPAAGDIQIEVAVSMMSQRNDPPKLKSGVIQLDEWVADHWELRDASGAVIPLRRSNFSKCIPESTAGTPEFYVFARVKPGQSYTLDFTPVVGETQRYRHKFVAPSAPDSGRVTFDPF